MLRDLSSFSAFSTVLLVILGTRVLPSGSIKVEKPGMSNPMIPNESSTRKAAVHTPTAAQAILTGSGMRPSLCSCARTNRLFTLASASSSKKALALCVRFIGSTLSAFITAISVARETLAPALDGSFSSSLRRRSNASGGVAPVSILYSVAAQA